MLHMFTLSYQAMTIIHGFIEVWVYSEVVTVPHQLNSFHFPQHDHYMQWRSQGRTQGPDPPKCLLCPATRIAKRSNYSNRTVKYSIKAVGRSVVPCQLTQSGYATDHM